MKATAIFIIFFLFSNTIDGQSLKNAIMHHDLEELKKYVKKYGPNYPEDKYYPLVAAAKHGHFDFVKYLMENGADINAYEYKKRTALMYALENDFIDIAKYLLGFDPNLTLCDYKKYSALEIAYQAGNYEEVKSLVKNNPFIAVDGPYIFKNGKKLKVVSILKKEDGSLFTSEKIIDKSSKNRKAACCGADGKTLFEFNIITKPEIEKQSTFDNVEQVIAISDIEGNLNEFIMLLKSAKVMDEDFNWIFGKNHLVLLGDFVDRGEHVTECLWLIYHLEQQAAKAAGKVHFLIGNHEEMNLRGNYKYVNFKYLSNADFMDIPYKSFFAKNAVLGKWLRCKNGMVNINGNLFVHAGISPEFAANRYSINYVNNTIRNYIDRSPGMRAEQKTASHVFDTKLGPLWYRGMNKDILSNEQVQSIMDFYKADRIIIGHTSVQECKTLFENRVINIDVKHSLGAGTSSALLIKDNNYYIIGKGSKKLLFKG